MNARIHFRGPLRYRLHCATELGRCVLEVSIRRALKGLPIYIQAGRVEILYQSIQAFADRVERVFGLDSHQSAEALRVGWVIAEKVRGQIAMCAK